MSPRTRCGTSGFGAPVSRNSRRVAEEDEDVKPVHKATRPSHNFIENTAALLRSMQETARSCSRTRPRTTHAINGNTTLDSGQNNPQLVGPSENAADDLSTPDPDVKRDGSPESVLPQFPPSSAHNDPDYDTITARLAPTIASATDIWVESAWCFLPGEVPAPTERVRRRRQRKPKSKSKGKTNFLSLPGELRNEIYKYLILECRILITCNKPNKELAQSKKVWSEQKVEHKRRHLRLCHLLDLTQAEQGLGITKSLLLACKQVRNDVKLYLYSRTTFCFSSTKALHRFLDTASKPGLRTIRKLEILHKGYGLPKLTEHQVFQDKYYERWSKICTRVGEDLSGLEHLKLEAHMRDWPCDLVSAVPNTPWRKACLQMAPRRLPKVEVKLFHHMIHRNDMAMKELARRLENDMMTQ